MAGVQSPKGATVVQYLKKYPKMPKLALAKLMHKEEPKMFPDIEGARCIIRSYTGQKGNVRINPGNKHGTAREKGVSGEDAWREMMPKSDAEDWEPFILAHRGGLRILLLSDIHLPFHSEEALAVAIEHGKSKNPNLILLNGDLLDCYQFSSFERDPRKRSVGAEMNAARSFFAMIRSAFPTSRIVWKLGNHEERYERWLMKYAPHLLDVPEFDYFSHLECAKHGVEIVKDKRIIHAGRLHILHGHEYRGFGGVNPARWLYLRTKDNAICGHFHRVSEHIAKTVGRKVQGAWSTGCLSELYPDYMRLNDWAHGFAFVSVEGNGDFDVTNYKIIDGKVC